ncbi:MAG TPA: YMGG-like glycine zipper-containing protein [Stellaceae bacterium]|nr:YMGG-like glycine zipper-containing protein [Stellaceae bacterium]
MVSKLVVMPAVVMMGVSMVGCAGNQPVQTAYGPMPAYCTQNNTATGAVIGGLLGAGLGAAIGGGRGAAIGAASGAALGGLTGAQADAQCRDLAMRQAAQKAFAAQAAAASRGGPPPSYYQDSSYITPSTGQSHTVHVTPLSNRTSAAGGGSSCVSVSDGTATKQVCQTPDGKINES